MKIGVAEHTETKEKLVVYVSLSAKAGFKMRVRPCEKFFESVEHEGKTLPRFEYLGSSISDAEESKDRDRLGQYQ